MTLAEYSMTAFALLNGGRIAAYLPQIMCIYRDRNGAASVSIMTWAMFTAANLATVSYSLSVSGDLIVASVFALNAACCFAITCLVARRRFTVASPARAVVSLRPRAVPPLPQLRPAMAAAGRRAFRSRSLGARFPRPARVAP